LGKGKKGWGERKGGKLRNKASVLKGKTWDGIENFGSELIKVEKVRIGLEKFKVQDKALKKFWCPPIILVFLSLSKLNIPNKKEPNQKS
jgi:hypothetical protein